MELHQLTATQAAQALNNKDFSAVDYTQACLDRIAATDTDIHAFLEVLSAEALTAAQAADTKRAAGEQLGPLAGVPISVKDIVATVEGHTTAASKILADFRSSYDASIITKLKQAGAIIIGKTNLDEFAHGASTEYSAFGPTKNPWDTSRVPGGSSGGAAASVAASQCPVAIGTDTGGSIRYPAAFCGAVGLKPSYGRSSRYGLLSMTSSTDCPGPITRTVEDAALVLQAMAGPDPADATSSQQPVPDYVNQLDGGVSGIKIGLPKEFFTDAVRPEVMQPVRSAIETLEKAGAEIVDVSLPHSQLAVAVYYVITPSEISANLARFDGIRFGFSSPDAQSLLEVYEQSRGQGFGPEVKRRIMLGTYALSSGYYDAYYRKAQQVRTVIRREFEEVFKTVDVLLTPSSVHTAFPIGQHSADPLGLYLEDVFMSGASIAGLPAMSLPCGFADNLPVGMQLIGKAFAEHQLFQVGHHYQQLTDWHLERPNL